MMPVILTDMPMRHAKSANVLHSCRLTYTTCVCIPTKSICACSQKQSPGIYHKT